MKYVYNIVMKTPIGEKKGSLYLNINNKMVSGSLNVLEKENIFTGQIDKDRKVILKGSIETIVSTLDYIAKGYIQDEAINLNLYGRQDVFNIRGTLLRSLKEGD